MRAQSLQQRLCIARAIAVEPDVILLDEPCSALDPVATLKIEELMFELRKDYTIVIVTHNMQQAAEQHGFETYSKYQQHNLQHAAQKNGFDTHSEYLQHSKQQ